MAATTSVETLDEISGSSAPKRPTKAFTQTFTAGTDGLVVDKRGFGLVGVSWPAGGTGAH